jgi:hydrogenase 3 maturation protease
LFSDILPAIFFILCDHRIEKGALMVRMLLGIGNPLRGDDGAGNYVAGRFRAPGWLALDCGTIPENFTGTVRKEHPELLVLVDAAEMGISPGEFRIILPDDIAAVTFGTHALPLSILIGFLAHDAGRVLFIGIQPAHTEMDQPLSNEVREGADRLIRILDEEAHERIEVYRGEG